MFAHKACTVFVFLLYFHCTGCISALHCVCTGAEFDKGCSQGLYLSLRHHNASPTPVTGVIGQLLPQPRPENHPPLPLSSHHLTQREEGELSATSIIEATFSPCLATILLLSISSSIDQEVQGIINKSTTFQGSISIWTFCLMQGNKFALDCGNVPGSWIGQIDHLHQICRWLHLPQFLDLLKFLRQGARVERLWKCCWVVPRSYRSDDSGCCIADDTS